MKLTQTLGYGDDRKIRQLVEVADGVWAPKELAKQAMLVYATPVDRSTRAIQRVQNIDSKVSEN